MPEQTWLPSSAKCSHAAPCHRDITLRAAAAPANPTSKRRHSCAPPPPAVADSCRVRTQPIAPFVASPAGRGWGIAPAHESRELHARPGLAKARFVLDLGPVRTSASRGTNLHRDTPFGQSASILSDDDGFLVVYTEARNRENPVCGNIECAVQPDARQFAHRELPGNTRALDRTTIEGGSARRTARRKRRAVRS